MSAGIGQQVRVVVASLRISVLAALQYRAGFWSEGVLGALWSAMGIFPLFIAVSHTQDVVGWGMWELIVLTGCFTFVSGVFGALLQPSLIATMEQIHNGALDYVLLRPADSLVLCLSTRFSPWRAIELLVGVGLIAGGLAGQGTVPTLADVARTVVVGGAGLLALYGLGVLALCLSFRAMQLQNLTFLMEASLDFARWPASVFRGLLKALFTFVVPFAVMTTYPAQAILGTLAPGLVLQAVGIALALALVSRLAWTRSLRGYTSASS
jgi:ABC-2 type transport system permease protein